jgi:hypothetical protein
MKTKTRKLIWFTNLSLLALVVFLGIQQGGRGAELAQMEEEIRTLNSSKQNHLESILLISNTEEIEKKAAEMGFIKPLAVVYVDTQDVLTSNLVR